MDSYNDKKFTPTPIPVKICGYVKATERPLPSITTSLHKNRGGVKGRKLTKTFSNMDLKDKNLTLTLNQGEGAEDETPKEEEEEEESEE